MWLSAGAEGDGWDNDSSNWEDLEGGAAGGAGRSTGGGRGASGGREKGGGRGAVNVAPASPMGSSSGLLGKKLGVTKGSKKDFMDDW